MDKFLIFVSGEDDMSAYPLKNLLAIDCIGDGAINFRFKSSVGGGTGAEHDLVACTIASNTEVAVTKQVIDKIAAFANNTFSKANFLEVANDVTGEYLVSGITAIAITQDT